MKFTEEHLHILNRNLQMDGLVVWAKHMADVYQAQGFSYRRFIWDWFWISKTKIGDGVGITSNCGIVGDYNDSHIETALRHIAKQNGFVDWGENQNRKGVLSCDNTN